MSTSVAPYILVLYYSQNGSTKELAYQIAQGIEESGTNITARIRTVPKVSSVAEQTTPTIPDEGDLYATMDDLKNCVGLAVGSATHFGNMSASMKYFWDNTVTLWLAGNLQNKPACVFTSTGTMHGGQETTLTSMMTPLLHHGMVIVGIPYSESVLNHTTSGGTPYGASHVSGASHDKEMTADEKTLAKAQGQRLAKVAHALMGLQ
ncbi:MULTISPECIES: NAD(P)H:quinone oxidoreductase [unclassified Moraxella]|uniref:NAD(P)H:quinone oxidoreductase n=1 Tax=unclassified Moraxella TaxID=2685852 RepID=UPI003AF9BA1C